LRHKLGLPILSCALAVLGISVNPAFLMSFLKDIFRQIIKTIFVYVSVSSKKIFAIKKPLKAAKKAVFNLFLLHFQKN